MSATAEVEQLRKRLMHSQSKITELKDELKEQEKIRYTITAERDKYRAKIYETKDAIKRMDEIVQMKVAEAIADEREKHRKVEHELTVTRNRLRDLERRLRDLKKDYDFLEGNTGGEALAQKMKLIKELKDDKKKMLDQLNDLSTNLEDILAENRILRKMNNIPDNWGCEPQKRIIKLQDRETVFEYKRLVKILQEDNYNLEKERAKLKHQLKQMAIFGTLSSIQEFKDLTPEQRVRLADFIIKLKRGETDEDKSWYDLHEENKNLKKELEILQTKGYNVIRQQLEAFFRENKDTLFLGMTSSDTANMTEEQRRFMEKMRKDQEKMQDMMTKMFGATRATPVFPTHGPGSQDEFAISAMDAGKFGPPRQTGPTTGFSTKFGTNLSVPLGGVLNPKDIPALQLQLVELFALNDRKDSQIKMLEGELERAYTKVRKYLLTQDQLYLNYVDEYQGYKEKLKKYEEEKIKLKDELREEQIQNERHRNAIRDLKLDPNSMSNQIINLHKKLALIEVENFKMAKKYAIIAEQEKQLRDAYHKVEEGFTERERYASERITKLKEWQIQAINELKFLYSKFKDAVPLGDYQNVSRELFIYKQKFADMMEKNNRLCTTNARLQTENRHLLIYEEKLKLYEEIRIDAENELEIVKKRLEILDPSFRWENAVFNRIIATLKYKRVSPQRAFELFDKDGNGTLDDREFMNALDKLGITDLTPKEKELLKRSIDPDNSGLIDYREFCRKCGRQGVMIRTKEDEIVYVLDEALKKHRLDLATMFEMMDKKGKGVITKEDFKDTLVNSRVNIDKKDLDAFVNLFWKKREEGINYRDFVRIYNRFKVRFDESSNEGDRPLGEFEITDEMVERNKWIYDKLNSIFKKNDISLKKAFERIDYSGDKKITRVELRQLFENMNVTCTDKEIEMMFKRMDFDNSGEITFNEFESDFNKIVNTDLETLIALNRERKQKTAKVFRGDGILPADEDFLASREVKDATKLSILESKANQLERKVEMYRTRLVKSEESQITWERDYDTLEKKYFETNERYQELLEKEQAYNTQKIGTLKKEDTEKIVLKSERQKEQIVDLQAAMASYKSLFEVASTQAKTLKLANKRSRDEEENLLFALRELQANSIDKMKLGRIYYILMLSRWQEAAIGMKYDYALNDVRTLRVEYTVVESRLKKEEEGRHLSESKLRDKALEVEHLKQELESKGASGISMTRAEEISRSLQDMADEKAEVEEQFIKIYSERSRMQFKIDDLEAKVEHYEGIQQVLRNATDSELSEKLIEMADKLFQIRRNELRSKREAEELTEQATYSERRINHQKKTIVDLEDKLADLESNLHRKEEEWRRADNERQKKFFDAQFVNFETESRYKGYVDDKDVRDKYKKEDLTTPPMGEFMIKKTDVRIMQAKIRNQEDEISSLRQQIISKEKQLDRLREWQLEDNLLSEDEKMKDIIDSNKVRLDQMHEKEALEITQAAHKSIRLLKELAENKENECKRKDEIIQELKKRMVEQKQADTKEIVKLNDQLNEAYKARDNEEYKFQKVEYKFETRHYEAISRRQLEALCYEKDKAIQNLEDEIHKLKATQDHLLNNKDDSARSRLMKDTDVFSTEQNKKIAALRRHIDTLTKKLESKQRVEERLNDTVREITDKLIRLEQMKGLTDEDIKMTKLTAKSTKPEKEEDQGRIAELEKMLQKKESRLLTTTQRVKTQEKELRDLKAKLLEDKEEINKLREEVKTSLQMRQKLIDQHEAEKREKRRKERADKKAEEVKAAGGTTNLELRTLVKQVERENQILKTQTKPIVAYNNESKAFEFIGEPLPLRTDGSPCASLEEFLTETKEWLKINHRLTVSTIFNSFDHDKSGYFDKKYLVPIFARLGIKIHENEVDMIFSRLNKDDPDLCKYRPLVVELTTGPRQLEFLPECCVEVAQLVLKEDISRYKLLSSINKNLSNKSTKDELMDGLDTLFAKDMKKDLVDRCYKEFEITRERVMDAEKFASTVVDAATALAIKRIKLAIETRQREYARDAREDKLEETKGLSLDNEFSKLDREHDGIVTFEQFDKLLDIYEMDDLKENARGYLKDILDLNRTNTITLAYIKQVFDLPRSTTSDHDGHFGLDMKPTKDNYREKEDEEIEMNARKALRRIYQKDNLIDKLSKQLKVYDYDRDGVMHRNILRQSIQDVTKDVHPDDVDYITQYADKRNKGYFNPEIFLDNIIKVAQDEAKKDALLRRVSNVLKHRNIDLNNELSKHSKTTAGIIDTYDFMRAMRELRIGFDGNDMEDLIRYASQGEKFIEIKPFCKMIEDVSSTKPISVSAPKTKKSDIAGKKGELSEIEQKRIQKKIEALTNQLWDAKKELEKVEKNAQDWKSIAEKNEKSLNILSDKLLDPKEKLKKMGDIQGEGSSAKVLKQQLRQQERILELNDKIDELQARNEELEKFIKVEAQTQLSDFETKTQNAQKKYKSIKSENLTLQNQIDKLVNASSSFEKNEEAEYARQLNIKNLEERIRELEASERDLHEELLRSEHQILDMKFEKENNNLKLSRLNDKIRDLENYIEIYTQLPPSMIAKAGQKGFDLETELSRQPGASKRPATELEKVIEGLKRVINTQKAELEQFKKKESKFGKKDDKVSTNKMLKDEIENLEKELKTIEEKDKEIAELMFKNQKMTEANKALNNDIKNEQKRYEFLESKYKELLVKYNVTFKDLEKKQDSLFTMSTGANRATYQEYLNHKENLKKQDHEDTS